MGVPLDGGLKEALVRKEQADSERPPAALISSDELLAIAKSLLKEVRESSE